MQACSKVIFRTRPGIRPRRPTSLAGLHLACNRTQIEAVKVRKEGRMPEEKWRYYTLRDNAVSTTKWLTWDELPERFKAFISCDRNQEIFSLSITTDKYTIVVSKEPNRNSINAAAFAISQE